MNISMQMKGTKNFPICLWFSSIQKKAKIVEISQKPTHLFMRMQMEYAIQQLEC